MSNYRLLLIPESSRVYIKSPFEAKEVCRALPGASWDNSRKMWHVPRENLSMVKQSLRNQGIAYDVYDDPPAPWAENIFSAFGESRARDLYRALSKVAHPDHGGSNQLMSELNSAYKG